MSLFDRVKAIAKALDGADEKELDAIAAYIITVCDQRARPNPTARTPAALIEENERLRAHVEDLKRWVIAGETIPPAILAQQRDRLINAARPFIDAAGRITADTPDSEVGHLRIAASKVRELRNAADLST